MAHATSNTRGKIAGKFARYKLPDPIQYYETQGIKLKGGGQWLDAICPFHADTKPSLRVNRERGAYRCMACGAHGGDIIAFHMYLYSMPFIAACKALGVWIGG